MVHCVGNLQFFARASGELEDALGFERLIRADLDASATANAPRAVERPAPATGWEVRHVDGVGRADRGAGRVAFAAALPQSRHPPKRQWGRLDDARVVVRRTSADQS